jgi:hypothetical protein
MSILKEKSERTLQNTTSFQLLYDRNSPLAQLYREWNLARTAFYQAHQNFEHATGEYIDVAVLELELAEKKMDAILKEIRRRKGELQ